MNKQNHSVIDGSNRLNTATKLNRLAEIGRQHGFFRQLTSRHSVLHVEEGSTLIVSFDTLERVVNHAPENLPSGFSLVSAAECSLLSVLGSRQSWFRDPALYAYFDELTDSGFFDQFDRVLFFGVGPMCGYGAMAYSVAAPGSHVLAISPVATLSRDAAPFERRYRDAWSLDFTSRYGYAPLMIEAAAQATVIYDPTDTMSAAHAALFDAPNTTRHKLRHGGMAIGAMLQATGRVDETGAARSACAGHQPSFRSVRTPSSPKFPALSQALDGYRR